MAFSAARAHSIGSSSPRLHPSSNATSASSDKSDARPVGELSVREIGPEGFALEAWTGTDWETLKVYTDFSTADEIRQIATTNPDSLSGRSGATPNKAILLDPHGMEREF